MRRRMIYHSPTAYLKLDPLRLLLRCDDDDDDLVIVIVPPSINHPYFPPHSIFQTSAQRLIVDNVPSNTK